MILFFNSYGKTPVVYVLKARNMVYSFLWQFTHTLKSSGTSLRLSNFILAKKKSRSFFSPQLHKLKIHFN